VDVEVTTRLIVAGCKRAGNNASWCSSARGHGSTKLDALNRSKGRLRSKELPRQFLGVRFCALYGRICVLSCAQVRRLRLWQADISNTQTPSADPNGVELVMSGRMLAIRRSVFANSESTVNWHYHLTMLTIVQRSNPRLGSEAPAIRHDLLIHLIFISFLFPPHNIKPSCVVAGTK
jgi:hypothetical protein